MPWLLRDDEDPPQLQRYAGCGALNNTAANEDEDNRVLVLMTTMMLSPCSCLWPASSRVFPMTCVVPSGSIPQLRADALTGMAVLSGAPVSGKGSGVNRKQWQF